jgi:4,5-DOPA dioxygenase extradiol
MVLASGKVLVRRYAMQSIPMTCYGFQALGILCREPECAARMPDGIPSDQTNI